MSVALKGGVLGVDVTEAPHATQKHNLGRREESTDGRVFEYVQFEGTPAQYAAVSQQLDGSPFTDVIVADSDTNPQLYGVNQNAAGVDEYFGWIQTKGLAIALTASVTAGDVLKIGSTAGTLVAAAPTGTDPTQVQLIALAAALAGASIIALSSTDTPATGQSYVQIG